MHSWVSRTAFTAVALFVSAFGSAPVARAQTEAAGQPGVDAQGVSASDILFVAQEVVQPLPGSSAERAARVEAASLQQLIGDMPLEIELSADLRCLAEAVYFEARGEPIEGQLAVAEVIINRAASSLYPDSYCGVVTQPAQFSFVRKGRIPPVNEASAAWARAKAVAQIAHEDLWESQAGDALYFHARYVKPGWARSKVQLAQIDTHIFYR